MGTTVMHGKVGAVRSERGGSGRRVSPAIGDFRDNLWMTNYETSVFLSAEDAAGVQRALPLTLGDVA